ncbi:MAG: DNA mismatch repair endonuclease MutL [Thermovirgaceae bacterium]|nr:DNA mismatch repair endonuclease MutL [Synergistales bacterium]
MKPIRQLSPDVSSRIAAGEVIENPASVVKELLENSLDAGAARITVELKDGGKTFIVVEDDGSGIPYGELPLAVERFATSKITEIDDLSDIGSFGYRGEALASVCAVSRLEIRSRRQGEEGGMLRAEGGNVSLHVTLPCRQGTRIQVEDLFFNLPARRSFLKGSATEARRAIKVVREYSAAFPGVAFRALSENREVFSTDGCLERVEVLRKVWGTSETPRHYIVASGPLRVETVWYPSPGSRRRDSIIFFNGRRVRDATVSAALSSCGEGASGNWMFFITVPARLLDVNVHPGKAEVRCHSSLPVFDTVRRSVLDLVEGGFMTAEGMRTLSDLPVNRGLVRRAGSGSFQGPPSEEGLFNRVGEPPFSPSIDAGGRREAGAGRFICRIGSGYLLFEESEGLLIIDPHAAHERILFERISSRQSEAIPQKIPLPVDLPPSLSERAEGSRTELEELGFRFGQGQGSITLESVPGGSSNNGFLDPLDLLRSTVAAIEDGLPPEFSLAGVPGRSCKAAIKISDSISLEEAEALLEDLFRCEEPTMCPHGRPTFIRLRDRDLSRLFGRGQSNE